MQSLHSMLQNGTDWMRCKGIQVYWHGLKIVRFSSGASLRGSLNLHEWMTEWVTEWVKSSPLVSSQIAENMCTLNETVSNMLLIWWHMSYIQHTSIAELLLRYLVSKNTGALCERSMPSAVLASKVDRSKLRMSSLSILPCH